MHQFFFMDIWPSQLVTPKMNISVKKEMKLKFFFHFVGKSHEVFENTEEIAILFFENGVVVKIKSRKHFP